MTGVNETGPEQLPDIGKVLTQILIEMKIQSMLLLELAKEYGHSDNLTDMRRDITILSD